LIVFKSDFPEFSLFVIFYVIFSDPERADGRFSLRPVFSRKVDIMGCFKSVLQLGLSLGFAYKIIFTKRLYSGGNSELVLTGKYFSALTLLYSSPIFLALKGG